MRDSKIYALYTNHEDTSTFDVAVIMAEDADGIVATTVFENGDYNNTQYIEKKSIFLKEYDNSYCNEIASKIDFEEIQTHYIDFKKK